MGRKRIKPKVMASFLVTFVRHGQSEGNIKRVIQGQSDYPLTELGIKQAEVLGTHFKDTGIVFDKAYSSDLKRAMQTCQKLTLLTCVPDKRLRERCYGVYETHPVEEYAKGASEAGLPAYAFIPEGSESEDNVEKRAADFFKYLSKQYLTDKCPHILVTAHGCFLRNMVYHLVKTYNMPVKKTEALCIGPNTGVTTVHVCKLSNDEFKVQFLKLNSDAHLKNANLESTCPPPV